MSKRKDPPRIVIRATEKEKDTIFRLAEKCGLSVSEYGRQRALGYEPRAVLPDAFFVFCEKLDKLTEAPFSKEVNKAALKLIRDMNAALISPGKEDVSELPQNRRFCGEKEHPRIGKAFDACGKSERKERDATWLQQASGPSEES